MKFLMRAACAMVTMASASAWAHHDETLHFNVEAFGLPLAGVGLALVLVVAASKLGRRRSGRTRTDHAGANRIG